MRTPSMRDLLGCAIAMLAAGGPGCLAAGAAPEASAALRQITHSINVDPSLSPDGSRMVYISVVSGREQLFIANIDGTDSHQITHDDVDHEDPAWSPDGRWLAFVSLAAGGEVISLIRPDGSGAKALTPVEVRAIHPNWTPDSRQVAYCTHDEVQPPAKFVSEIDLIDIDTRKITRVISGGENTYPSVSPDGRRLAFRRLLGEANSEVFIANIDGTDQRNLTQHPAFDGWPSWSPDGAQLAFASNRDGDHQVYVMRADGRDPRRVAATSGRATAPVWSKDGASIYFPLCRRMNDRADCEIFAAPVPAMNTPLPD